MGPALEGVLDLPYVVLDFTDVTYVDSTALAELIVMQKARATRGHAQVHLAGLSSNLQRSFANAGLDGVWPTFDTVEGAISAFDVEH